MTRAVGTEFAVSPAHVWTWLRLRVDALQRFWRAEPVGGHGDPVARPGASHEPLQRSGHGMRVSRIAVPGESRDADDLQAGDRLLADGSPVRYLVRATALGGGATVEFNCRACRRPHSVCVDADQLRFGHLPDRCPTCDRVKVRRPWTT